MTAPPEDATKTLMFERKFHVKGLGQRVVLHVFEPTFEQDEWICEYQLNVPGWDQQISVPIVGADKLQSVTSAFRRIRSDLAIIEERLGRQVTWLGEPRLDLI